ncbi:hypothetical protein HDU76_012232, partial [Blyttiomyces sp. JEL0837]
MFNIQHHQSQLRGSPLLMLPCGSPNLEEATYTRLHPPQPRYWLLEAAHPIAGGDR